MASPVSYQVPLLGMTAYQQCDTGLGDKAKCHTELIILKKVQLRQFI